MQKEQTMLRIHVEIENPSPDELEHLSGFLMMNAGKIPFTVEEPVASPEVAFGPVSKEAPISTAGPHLVVAATPVAPLTYPSRDKDGLPWDDRIHASSKALNADGTWRKKRGVSDAEVTQVEAQLRGVIAIPAVPPPPPLPVEPAPAAPAPVVEDSEAFVKLVGRASAAIQGGKLTQDQVTKCVESIGIPQLFLLGTRLDLVPQAAALIDGIIAGNSAQ
jgi:hypothetical protein